MKNKLTKLIAPTILASMMIVPNAFAYTVIEGDTLSEIATRKSMTLQELASLNPQISNVDLIYPGQAVNTSEDKTPEAPKKVLAPPTPEVKSVVKQEVKTSLTANEKDLLARLVRAEATGEPYAGKVAVATVVLNRVDSNLFPDTVTAVIYQRGQFSPITNGSINRPADEESMRAVEDAIREDRSNNHSLFFYNPRIASSSWLGSRPTTEVIGNHVFKQ